MGLFETALNELAHMRQREIVSRLPRRKRQRHDVDDGFMPPEKAAEVMGCTVEAVVELALRGSLEYRSGDRPLIRPAVVSVLSVQ